VTPKQLRRLHQIELQVDVVAALKDPEVAQIVQLTDEQRNSIRTIEEEEFRDILRSIRSNSAPANDASALATKPLPTKNERVLGLFTEEQMSNWRALTGPYFKGAIRLPSPLDLFVPAAEFKGRTD
jgi:hypothetical protein